MKKKTLILIIGIMLVASLLLGTTYAYWQITKEQTGTNNLAAACLNLSLGNESGTFGSENTFPISDAEGKALDGYTFTVTNNCEQEINYAVGIDSLTVAEADREYLNYAYLKVQIDNNKPLIYNSLEAVERDNTRTSKVIATFTISGTESEENSQTHTVRIWISSEAPVTEQNKIFSGKVFIIGGQGIEVVEQSQILVSGDISKTIDCEDNCTTVTGNNVTYTYDSEGLLEIDGTGEMQEWYDDSTVREQIDQMYTTILKDYINNSSNGVTQETKDYINSLHNDESTGFGAPIGGYASFSDLISMTGLTLDIDIENELTSIYNALGSITEINIKNGVTNVGEYMFFLTGPTVTSINLADSVIHIGTSAFSISTLANFTIKSSQIYELSYIFEDSTIQNLIINAGSTLPYQIFNKTIVNNLTINGNITFDETPYKGFRCSGLTAANVTFNNSSNTIDQFELEATDCE